MDFGKSFKLRVFYLCKEMLIYYIVDFLNIFVSVRLPVFVCLFDCLLFSYLSVSLSINYLASMDILSLFICEIIMLCVFHRVIQDFVECGLVNKVNHIRKYDW